MRIAILIVIVLFIVSCKTEESRNKVEPYNFYPFNKNRVAAEWEPAKGVIFTCPPVIPKELIIEFAKDTHIYPVVDSKEEQAKALMWFQEWGIDTNKVAFIMLPEVDYDVIVPRDWGPPAVFQNNGKMKLADAEFVNSDPFSDIACNDSIELHKVTGTDQDYYSTNADTLIIPLARKLGFDVLDVPFTSTGGNVLTDGIGSAFSTCILLTENRFNGVSDKEFFALNDSLLGFKNYHVISNFEKYGIQHIDCFLKIIDEETILVAQTPEDHELYDIYENIVDNELSNLRNAYGRPYVIKRIKLGRIIEEYLTAYTNSLILNKTVYVPLYGVETDSLAIETWKSVMPGYSVKGFEFVLKDQPYLANWKFEAFLEFGEVPGWAPDDALHCRTRAIWDEDMIFISLKKVTSESPINQDAVIYATIRDYSDTGLNKQAVKLYWRVKGSKSWNVKRMNNADYEYHWISRIPPKNENTVIEYYVEAISKSGKSGRRPITAPEGFYTFKYVVPAGSCKPNSKE